MDIQFRELLIKPRQKRSVDGHCVGKEAVTMVDGGKSGLELKLESQSTDNPFTALGELCELGHDAGTSTFGHPWEGNYDWSCLDPIDFKIFVAKFDRVA
jgi:hypothetical protein